MFNNDERWDICIRTLDILIDTIRPGDSFYNRITYERVAENLNEMGYPSIRARHVSPSLGYISMTCVRNGLPPLSAIVINKNEDLPARIYFDIFTIHGRRDYCGLMQYVKQLKAIWSTEIDDWNGIVNQINMIWNSNQEFHFHPDTNMINTLNRFGYDDEIRAIDAIQNRLV